MEGHLRHKVRKLELSLDLVLLLWQAMDERAGGHLKLSYLDCLKCVHLSIYLTRSSTEVGYQSRVQSHCDVIPFHRREIR